MEFKIEKATRKALPISMMLCGASGSGKTFSALKLAQGLLDNPDDRICLIDTENSRASYYSDVFDFDVINIDPPHTPERYLSAFRLAESKYKVIIIDSFSLAWEGEGGCCDIAEEESERLRKLGKSGKGLNTWLKPKLRHRKLANAIYASKVDKILCCRTKDSSIQVGSSIVKEEDVIVCEKSVPFNMLIKFYLKKGVPANVESCVLNMIESKLNIKGYLTSNHGKIIKQWVNEGEAVNIELNNMKKECREKAMKGSKGLEEFILDLDPKSKDFLNSDSIFRAEVRALAKNADAQNEEYEENESKKLDLNNN